MNTKIAIQRRCEHCGKIFTSKVFTTRFCSTLCNFRFHKAEIRVEKIQRSNYETMLKAVCAKISKLDKEILTVKEVAGALGVSKVTIYEMINSGQIKATKLGERMTRILRSDLLIMLEVQKFSIPPIAKEKKVAVEISNSSIALRDGYRLSEIIAAFGKSREALYIYLKRHKVPREKVGKEIVLSKDAVDELYRKLITPKPTGINSEVEANLRLAKKTFKISECYSIEECVIRFGKPRNLLYGIFNRRKVPRINRGRNIFVPKEVVDRIFLNLKKRES